MDSHRIEIRLIAGDNSWQYSWSAETAADPNTAARAAFAYVGVLAAAASGAWPAENVKAMVERADREFPQFAPAHDHGADSGMPAALPADDTEPQTAEGVQILSVQVPAFPDPELVDADAPLSETAPVTEPEGDSNGE